MQRLWYILLSMLGFTACNSMPMDMYGTPTVDYTVKGKVTDSDGNPIKGIVVSSKSVQSFDYGSGLSAVTGEDGAFVTNKVKDAGVMGYIVFTDTDGEENGGDFQTAELNLNTLPRTKVVEGDGWYSGEYEVNADIKLEKR